MGRFTGHIGRKDEKETIVHEWCTQLIPSSDARMFEGDVSERRFSNPIAYHIVQASQEVVGYIFSPEEEPATPAALDDLCRILALQTAKPSEAFAAFFKLRSIILSKRGAAADAKATEAINRRIDQVVLDAIDRYTACREQVKQYELDELKKKNRILERVAYGSGPDRGVA